MRTADDVVSASPGPPDGPGRSRRLRGPLAEAAAWREADGTSLPGWPSGPAGPPPRSAPRWLTRRNPERRAAVTRASAPTRARQRSPPLAGVLATTNGACPVITARRPYVTRSSRRAATGTHYTPRSLAEEVAIGALRTAGLPARSARNRRRDHLAAPAVLRDPGAAGGRHRDGLRRVPGRRLPVPGRPAGRSLAGRGPGRRARRTAAPAGAPDRRGRRGEQVLLDARRLVAEHCLYGVDINPLAVEMAKLSLWLITMDRERPFGFLDDRLVCGDSLLGLASRGPA